MTSANVKPDELMLTCRIPKSDLTILERIREAYGLKSRSAAIRKAYRQVASDRALSDRNQAQRPSQAEPARQP